MRVSFHGETKPAPSSRESKEKVIRSGRETGRQTIASKSPAPNCKKPAKSRGDEVESKIAQVILSLSLPETSPDPRQVSRPRDEEMDLADRDRDRKSVV